MRALVLGHRLDPTCNAVAAALAQRGGCQVNRCDITDLATARWHHRLTADGHVATQINGGGIDIGACDIVFNRLGSVQALPFRGWRAADRDYGQAEWLALLVSWLASLGRRVIGAPSGSDLCGPSRRPWLWQAAAAAAGLAVHPAGATTSLRQFPVGRDAVARPELLGGCNTHAAFADRGLGHAAPAAAFCDLLIIGSAVFGADDPGADVRAACLGMAEARQTPVLAVTLARQAGDPRWRFVDADAAPTITEGAPLAALADLMVARAG